LYTIGKGLTGVLDIEALFEIVHAEVSHVIPFEWFLYASCTDQPGVLTTGFEVRQGQSHYYRPPFEAPVIVKLPGTVFEETLAQGKPWLGQAPGGDFTGGSMMAVPVRSKQKIVGMLSLVHSSRDIYNETHLRLLESIANLTEIALDKALLYADTINKSIEIQNRNKELDDFTYVVSHDLKEPLISIEGYSKILLKDYKDRVDDEGREYLGTVVQSSGRMKSLIDDLLTLSRLGRTAEAIQTVSVAETVNEIVRDLQFTLNEKGVRLTVPPALPDVQYNRTQLGMVFRNLIANAMKFNDKPDPSITIGVKEEPGEYVFSVADNGIGIEQQYFDRIFMIFQRLQRSEEFRGTGAGLTIVKKIVENHKGRIWLDSVLGSGTTFYFSVPKVQPLPEPV
jgi:signal transduction histidine kinase